MHRSSLAGTWYPAKAERLREDVERYLAPEPPRGAARVRALLLPHAGYRWSGPVAGQAVSIWKGRRVGRVVVMGPSHRARLENAIAMPSSDEIETPLGRLAVDRGFLEALSVEPVFRWIPEAHVGEHSVEVELPLLQQALGTFSLVPLVVGDLDPDLARRAAAAIATRLGPDDVVVASSDFTHYGPRFDYVPFQDDVPRRLRALDLGAVEAIERCDPDAFTEYVRRTGATICGHRPIEVLLHMLPAGATARLVAYDTSGAIGGDWDSSVSYAAMAFAFEAWRAREGDASDATGPRLDREDRRALLALARHAIAYRLANGREPDARDLGYEPTPGTAAPAGAFVTLERNGRLCGCIGRLAADRPLWRTVVNAAIGAAVGDLRFRSVRADEVDALQVEISVLTPLRPVADASEIVLGRDGIVLSKGKRSATFLPHVATEMRWDLAATLSHLARKAGLVEDEWREGATLQVFQAEVLEEPRD